MWYKPVDFGVDNTGFPSEIMRLAKLIACEACELKREEEVDPERQRESRTYLGATLEPTNTIIVSNGV